MQSPFTGGTGLSIDVTLTAFTLTAQSRFLSFEIESRNPDLLARQLYKYVTQRKRRVYVFDNACFLSLRCSLHSIKY